MSKFLNAILNVSEMIRRGLDSLEGRNSLENFQPSEVYIKCRLFENKASVSINDCDTLLLRDDKFYGISTEKVSALSYKILEDESFLIVKENTKSIVGILYMFPQVIIFRTDFKDVKNGDFEVDILNTFNLTSNKWINGISLTHKPEISIESKSLIEMYSKNILEEIKRKLDVSEEEDFFKGFYDEAEKFVG